MAKGKIFVHCPDKNCNEFFVAKHIAHAALGKRVCVCNRKLISYSYQGEVPILPKGHSYRFANTGTTNSQSDFIIEEFSAGELDLATSFWAFLFAGTLVVGLVCGFLSAAYGKGWYIPLIGYTIFAIQGTWKSAEKYKIEQKKKKQSEVWGFLAQVVCVMNGISIIGMIAEFF